MREQLNNNPVVQVAAIAVLLLAGGIFFLTSMGGGGESSEGEAGAAPVTGEAIEGSVETLEAGVAEPGLETAPAASAPLPPVPTPAPVVRAWDSGATVALLFVRDGGIDDRIVRDTAAGLSSFPGVTPFTIEAADIARYAAITGGVGVDRLPALVVLAPKRASDGVPTGSILYGYQTPANLRQAIIDAGYEGPTLDYHP
jgi:hypothetical protein